jgi:glycosyltransferase involved in cell wall biosynthesis
MRVAYFSPLPPERSGVADYSALLVPALSERVELELVKRGRRSPRRSADLCLYHVGNSPEAHGWIMDAMRRRPGLVVLHEHVLHHLVAGITIGRKDGRAYLDAMERDAGLAGRLLAHGVLEGRVPPLWETRPQDFPMVREALAYAIGLIVHSGTVEQQVREAGFSGPVWRIPHPAWPLPEVEPAPIAGEPLIGSFGHLNASKRVPQLLEAFVRLHAQRPGARLLLVGSEAPGFDVGARIERLGLADSDALLREPYVSEERLWALMAATDICVNLRYPTMGETSGTAIRALVLGKALVTSDVGWFAELPDEVALKVAPGEEEPVTLAAAFELLAQRSDLRESMGRAAAELAVREHSLGRVADLYAAAIEEAAGGEVVKDAVLHELAEAAAEIGIVPEGEEAAELAERMRELGLGDR